MVSLMQVEHSEGCDVLKSSRGVGKYWMGMEWVEIPKFISRKCNCKIDVRKLRRVLYKVIDKKLGL